MRVEFYGVLREVAGCREMELDLEAPLAVAEVLAVLERRLPALADHLPRTACAVGDSLVHRRELVAPDASLALLPPVSGG